MRWLWAIITLLWCAPGSFAQQLQGRVTSQSNEPIPFATLRVLNTEVVSIADSTGRYSMSLPNGTFSIEIRSVGYASQIAPVQINNSPLQKDFALRLKANSLDETVVTANRNEQGLSSIPSSVTLLSAEKLHDSRTWKLEDLQALVPNYQYAELGVGYQQMQSIRGISVFSENPSVATYIDGVSALDVSANGIQFSDIERIEILRGPQGTLYGRSAMGGVISIITKKPTAKSSGHFEASIGNQGLQRYAFDYKMPILKNRIFSGFSGQYQKQFGFYTNDLSDKRSFDGLSLKGTPEDGQRMGDAESFYGNFHLKWLINEKWDIALNVKAQLDQSTGPSMYYQAVENEQTAVNDPYKMAVNSLGSHRRSLTNSSLAVNHRHQKFSFISVSAYQHVLQTYTNIDQDLFPYDLATGSTFHDHVGDAMPQHVFSQELRFMSPASAKRLTWTAGAYFFHQQYDKRFATQYERLALLFGEVPGVQVSQNDERNLGAAAFGQAAYKVKEKWEFTVGLRYDAEFRSSTLARFRIDSIGQRTYTLAQQQRDAQFQSLSPKAAVSYALNRQHGLYLSYSRGFRAGGINTASNTIGHETYAPEYSDNIELGYRFQSENGKYAVNTSFFYLYWTDLQLDLRTDNGIYVMDNIGNVQAFGFEIEAQAKPISNLTTDVSIGFNHSRYQDFQFLDENIKGNNTILAPPVTAFVAAQYQFNLPKKVALVLRGEWRYMGEQYFDLINTIRQPGYSLFNARVEVRYSKVGLGFWIQNIADQQYITYAMPGYFRYTVINRPRAFGATLNITF
jgi:iron complex outermembrane receptor protein